MKKTANLPVLERLLQPLSNCFTPDVAQALADLRIDAKTQARIDELANKCTEGQLSERERSEYQTYVTAIDMIGILQSKARKQLRDAAG